MKDFFENLLSNGELQEKVAELQGKIDAYQISENEANEIIAELKAENERLKEEITELEEKFLTLNGKSYSYYMTLQEIKNILLQAMDVKSNAYNHFLKVEQAIDLITETEEE